jgi:hypothetical protein
MTVRALYGFSPSLAPFAGKTPAEQVDLLRAWGSTAIFGGYQEPGFVEASQRAGLKVYAEFPCFVGEAWWKNEPASRPVRADGQLLEPDGWYYGVNPAIPSVRQAQWGALEKLLRDYELDGVWLDFIRWPCRWEGADPYRPLTSFDAITTARFSQDTGIGLPAADAATTAAFILAQHEAAWVAWRCDQVTTWVAEAKAIVERIRPGTILGLFGVPWRLADYEGAILRIMGQDYRALGRYVDVFSPMVYHRLCHRPLAWIASVTQEVHALSGKPVWPIIQSVDEPEPLTAEEYGQALDLVLHSRTASGILVFNLKGALSEAKLAITQMKFKEFHET